MKGLGMSIKAVATRISSRWLLPVALGIVILFFPIPSRPRPPVERIFRIEASRFAYAPSILKVNQGDQVTLELVATDVVHGLAVDGYGLQVTANPGQAARLTFTADMTGIFRFRCSATCGPLHPFMIGKIQVGENLLWWRAAGLAILAVVVVLGRRLA
jgi:heme/copper-type cytochrome/quinol oxidase subunit 2